MSSIGGSGGSIRIGSGPTKSTDTPVATVQVGESKLSDLAQRLGIDAKTLQDANPHISDPEKLKVGQEINLPQFQASEPLKQTDGPGLQDQGLRSTLPRAPMGDSVARNVMKARLSATDLAQVPGGVQDSKGRQMKVAEKDASAGDAAKMDKYSESSKADAEKSSQKADDLAQVQGGAQESKGQEAKATEKDAGAGDAASGAATKMDKYSESSKADAETSSQKADDLAQVQGGAQDSKGQEAKATGKDASAGDAAKMDKYSESSKADAETSSQKADDLAQVQGGAQDSKGQEAKATEKDGSAGDAAKIDKYSESSKADVDKSFQKADDLAQVPGGAKHKDIQQMKFTDKDIKARDPKKFDKDYGDRSFYKPDGTVKVADAAQKVTLSKQKTANKASAEMDDYLKR